jgi:hypothetical protein
MPITPRQLAEAAVRVRRAITVDEHATTSHRVAVVRGLDDVGVVENLGTYLVGAGFARAVRTSLRITRQRLQLEPQQAVVIRQAIDKVIGADNGVDRVFKTDQRDPWIAEGIAHLVLWLSRRQAALAARGRIQALAPLHIQSKEQGIDLAALYLDGADLGVHIGEAKATENNATTNVAEAAAFFREIDAADPIRILQVVNVVQLLRESLRSDIDERVTDALWEDNRCYGAVVAYGNGSSSFSPTRARHTYRNLAPGSQHVLLVCLCLDDYPRFFDHVANAMRGAI